METHEHLNTYLKDHRAGSAAGTSLARHLWKSVESGPWGPDLERIVEEIRGEKDVLDEVRSVMGAAGGLLKRVGALALEQVSLFKMTRGLGESPSGRVTEVEALMSGVQAKQRLWASLRVISASRPELGGFDFAALEQQSADQLRTLGEVHEWAVREAWETPAPLF